MNASTQCFGSVLGVDTPVTISAALPQIQGAPPAGPFGMEGVDRSAAAKVAFGFGFEAEEEEEEKSESEADVKPKGNKKGGKKGGKGGIWKWKLFSWWKLDGDVDVNAVDENEKGSFCLPCLLPPAHPLTHLPPL